MKSDTKEMIADAAETLLLEKKVKRLTVKRIVEECNITRQAFYYHFADIPELLKWILEKDTEKLLEECLEKEDSESGLFHLFSFAIRVRPYVKAGVQTNHGNELGRLLDELIYDFFDRAIERTGIYAHYSSSEKEFFLQYHCLAIKGILEKWTEKDTQNMKFIVHQIHLLLMGKIHP